MIHEDFIAKDTSVTDVLHETYYSPLTDIRDNPNGEYLRVRMDHGAYDVETRISYTHLESLGWRKM